MVEDLFGYLNHMEMKENGNTGLAMEKIVTFVDHFQIPDRQVAEKRWEALSKWSGARVGISKRRKSSKYLPHKRYGPHTHFGQLCLSWGNCPAIQ
jgi:hypothetical protein